jgi:hypothetical protein
MAIPMPILVRMAVSLLDRVRARLPGGALVPDPIPQNYDSAFDRPLRFPIHDRRGRPGRARPAESAAFAGSARPPSAAAIG